MCWALTRAQVSEDEIAIRLKIDIAQVKQGYAIAEAWRVSQSHEIVDANMNAMVIDRIDAMGSALDDALAAERVRLDGDGNLIQEPDHHTRLDAMEKISTILRDIRPKGGDKGISVGIINQNNNAAIVAGNGARSFEARVRKIREERGMRQLDNATTAEVVGEDEVLEDGQVAVAVGVAEADDDVIDDEVEPDYPEGRTGICTRHGRER